MKIVYFIILQLFASGFCYAQEILPQPKATFITRFQFRQYSGGVMILKARFDNVKDTLNFILDTGSGGISLDSATCTEFNIPVTATDTTIIGIGGIRRVPFVFNKTLHFPGLSIPNLNFHINDYSVLSSVYGEKIDGIIGYSFFSRYIVKINFDSNFIDVFNIGKFEYPKGGYILHPAFTALPIQWGIVKDRKKIGYNYYFDTGAGLYLLLSEAFIKDSSLLLRRRKPVLTQAEGMSGKSQMKLTVVKEFKIGPYKFRNIPTYIYDDEYNVTNYPHLGGLIGNDLLRRFNMTINYPAREIHLIPNKNFDEPFDYAYTGLGIYYVNEAIMIEDVIPGSPGDKAGLQVGDQIIGVNTNFSNNIQAYKDILQTTNVSINILIKRNEVLKIFILKPISIQ